MLSFRRGSAGFSLIEFMIAITVSLILLAALTSTFVANSRARGELERANQQIENGRYALSVLADDLQLAGYLAEFNLRTAGLANPPAKARPCATTVAELLAALPVHIQGYDNVPDTDNDGAADVADIDDDGTAATDLDCLPAADVRPGSDILVVRHVSPCVDGSANCPNQAGAPYFQASYCTAQLNDLTTTPGSNVRESFRLDTVAANLNRTRRNCTTAAPARRYLVHIYFLANNDVAGDGIPTLKRAELTAVGGAAAFQVVSIANGIDRFNVEYGIDCGTSAACAGIVDGAPDVYTANPDTYNRASPAAPFGNCAANASCVQNWLDTTTVKVSLLAQNLVPSRDYVDSKVYTLGQDASGAPQCALDTDGDGTCEAYNDAFRRHVYQSAIRLTNPAVRREIQ